MDKHLTVFHNFRLEQVKVFVETRLHVIEGMESATGEIVRREF